MFSNVISKTLAFLYIIFTITLYGLLANVHGLPTFLAPQWFKLSNTLLVSIASISSFSIISILMILFGIDKQSTEIKVQLYNIIGDNVYSKGWYILMFIYTIICFQYALYWYAFAYFMIALGILSFYILHKNIIKNAMITTLK
ncbi:g489 [Yersinia phage fHe-Yen9-04]|uniref:G489 protein n=1 Tax=Yersinia phage fHe-Yen9-04 TaxID=2052742 RepID=A0A2C9CY92_9CAUD|nr:hypothetical protein FDJ41_gp414 [Yersinia phage fHe-Yen9-04]SOK58766.1 g489 [Yersinia phage fHe-Yen9-04]VUE36535.1 g489 [Yersinia phage fHe-Yen9-04]